MLNYSIKQRFTPAFSPGKGLYVFRLGYNTGWTLLNQLLCAARQSYSEGDITRLLNLKMAAALFLILTVLPAQGVDNPSKWNEQNQAWRNKHAQSLSAADGWLSVVALDWLTTGENSFGTNAEDKIKLHIPGHDHFGVVDVEPNAVRLKAPRGGFPSTFKVDGHVAREQELVVDGTSPTTMTSGTLTFFIIRRGDRFALRVKDSHAPARREFHGLRWYRPNLQYVIEAEWIPYPEPKQIGIQNVVGIPTKGLTPGVAKLRIKGQDVVLEPFVQSVSAKELLFVIRDSTSVKATYPASRFLHTGLPDHGLSERGKIVLDFNRLENPPCAFTPLATCPLPPPNNRIRVALAVGELRYSH